MGLETLFELYKDSAKSRLHEVLLCFHSCLLERNVKCIGKILESSQSYSGVKGSELLPSGWNDDPNTVELYYIHTSGEIFKVLILNEGTSCLLHLLSVRPNEEKTAFIEINLNDHINETDHKTVDKVYKNIDALKKILAEQLINVVIGTSEASNQSRPHQPFESAPPYASGYRGEPGSSQVDPLRDYGRADVDPFYVEPGVFGTSPPGGMIFDPFRSVRPRAPDRFSGLIQPLPRGSVPPGARFDPFGPPGTGLPDPDLERKPNFHDDFYS